MIRKALTDIEIWFHFIQGDDRALALIYTATSPKLFRYGMKFTSDQTIVEEAIHDLFLYLINNRASLGLTDNILFYLLKALKRELLRKMKQEGKSPKSVVTKESSFSWSVEDSYILEETTVRKSEIILQAIDHLSRRQREVIYLRYCLDYDYQTIANIMSIEIETCRNLSCSGLKTLKGSLKEEDVSFLKSGR